MSTENTNAPVQAERTITIYATRGNSEPIDVLTNVTTWGEFMPILENKGYNTQNVLCTESVTKTDLVNRQAILPTGDFTLFIRNKETKSGADLSYKELKSSIKAFFQADPTGAKAHFGNYTHSTTDALRRMHKSYVAPAMSDSPNEGFTEAPAVEEVVEEVALIQVTSLDRAREIEGHLSMIKSCTEDADIIERVESVEEEMAGLIATLTQEASNNSSNEQAEKEEAEAKAYAEKEQADKDAQAQADRDREAQEKADREAAEADARRLKQERKDALAKEARSLGL